MMGSTHKAVGIACGCTLAFCFVIAGQPTYALAGVFAPAGAMFPDIDHNSTKLGRKRKKVVSLCSKGLNVLVPISVGLFCMYFTRGAVLSVVAGFLVLLLLCSGSYKKIKRKSILTIHRGITHTLLCIAPLVLIGLCCPIECVAITCTGLAWGWCSHLLCDSMTEEGCPLLYPLVKENIHIARIRTGTSTERVGASIACIILCIMQYIVLLK